jgi:hypothetical protein
VLLVYRFCHNHKLQRGRLIYRAWEETNGKVIAAYFKAVENTTAKFNKLTSIVDVKRAA